MVEFPEDEPRAVEAETAAAPPPGDAPAAPAPTDALVEQWFRDHFHGRPIETSLFNGFYAAKLDLMARLRALTK